MVLISHYYSCAWLLDLKMMGICSSMADAHIPVVADKLASLFIFCSVGKKKKKKMKMGSLETKHRTKSSDLIKYKQTGTKYFCDFHVFSGNNYSIGLKKSFLRVLI